MSSLLERNKNSTKSKMRLCGTQCKGGKKMKCKSCIHQFIGKIEKRSGNWCAKKEEIPEGECSAYVAIDCYTSYKVPSYQRS